MHDYINPTSFGVTSQAVIDVNSVCGLGEATYPRLHMQMKLAFTESQGLQGKEEIQAVSFGMFTGELWVGSEKMGDALPQQINRIGMQYHPYNDSIYVDVEVPLISQRIEKIEQFREGKSFTGSIRFNLGVNIYGVLRGQTGDAGVCGLRDTETINGQVSFIVPDTQWREKVLPGLGYGKVIAIEFPAIPIESIQAVEHSFKALEQAQKQFLLGHYDEAVGKCRIALEHFFESVDKGDGSGKKIPKLKKSWETRLGESTYRWLDEAFGAIKVAANKPHHSPNNHFDRLGAQMLLMVTTALISYAAREIGQE